MTILHTWPADHKLRHDRVFRLSHVALMYMLREPGSSIEAPQSSWASLSPSKPKIHSLMTSEGFNKRNLGVDNTRNSSLESVGSLFLEGRHQEKLLGVNSGGKRLSAEGGTHYWKDGKPPLFHGLCRGPGRCDMDL